MTNFEDGGSFSRNGDLDEAFNVRIAKAEIILITKTLSYGV
jgi:hypothetical protein